MACCSPPPLELIYYSNSMHVFRIGKTQLLKKPFGAIQSDHMDLKGKKDFFDIFFDKIIQKWPLCNLECREV